MHSYSTGGTTFLHNGDFSGDVEMVDVDGNRITIPMADLVQFVHSYEHRKAADAFEVGDVANDFYKQ